VRLLLIGLGALVLAVPAATAAPKPDAAPTNGPKPAYIQPAQLEAAFQENGAVQQGRTRMVLKVMCAGLGYPAGSAPSRYHIFDCRVTTALAVAAEYHVITFLTGSGVSYSGELVPQPAARG
jgi:hypothetical protein